MRTKSLTCTIVTLLMLCFNTFLTLNTKAQTTIDCDEDVTGFINVEGAFDEYTFTATAGDWVIVRMESENTTFDPKIQLRELNGDVIAENETFGDVARIGALQLENGGSYVIRAEEKDGNQTGGYGLSLQIITPDCVQGSLDCDGSISGNISRLAEMDAYVFEIVDTTGIIIRMESTNTAFDPRIELYAPSGELIEDQETFGEVASIGMLKLTEPGIYTVVAMEKNGTQTGSYNLSLQTLDPECAQGSLPCDGTVTGNINTIGGMESYTFEITDTTGIILRMESDNSAFNPRMELYGPDCMNIENAQTFGEVARIGMLKLTEPGVYTVLAMEKNGTQIGSYNLSLQTLNPECAQGTLPCDGSITGSINTLGGMETYTFEITDTTGIILRMESDNTAFNPRMELYGPDCTNIDNAQTFGEVARIGLLKLTEPGIYTVVAMEKNGTQTGSYNLSLQTLDPECAQGTLPCDGSITGNINTLGGMETYTFEITETTGIILRLESENTAFNPRMELYGPDCTEVGSDQTFGEVARIGTLKLTEPGIYTVVAMEKNGTQTGSYNLSLQTLDPECAQGTLPCDGSITGNINTLGGMETYTFEITETTGIILRMESDNTAFDPRMELYGPDCTNIDNAQTFGEVARIGMLKLTEPGTYTVVAMEKNGTQTGSYNLSLQTLDPECAQGTLPCDGSITGNINTLGGMESYNFYLDEPASIILQLESSEFAFDPRMELYGPDCQLVQSAETFGDLARIGAIMLADTGLYTVVVMEGNGTQTGAFDLSLQRINVACTEFLDCAGDISGNFSFLGEMQAFSVVGQAGQQMLIRSYQESFGFDTRMELYRTDGSLVTVWTGDNNLEEIHEFEQNDTLIVVLMDEDGLTLGDFGFSAQLLDPACATALICEQDTVPNLLRFAQIDAFAFSGEMGDKVRFRLRPTNSAIDGQLRIYNDQGELINSFTEPNNGIIEQEFDLTASGQYLAVFTDDVGNETGTYGFSYQMIKPTCTTVSPNCDEIVSTTIGKLAEMDAYLIAGAPGQTVVVQIRADNSNLDLEARLYAANGTFLQTYDEMNNGLIRFAYTFNSDGDLIILIQDRLGDEMGNYHFSAQFLGSSNSCSMPILCGGSYTDNLNQATQMNTYTFFGATNDRGIIRMTDLGSEILSNITLYTPSGMTIDVPVSGSPAELSFGPLEETGTYTILATDSDGNGTGSFELSLQITNDHSCGMPITYNTNETAAITQVSEMDGYILEAQAGDVFIFQVKGTSATFDPSVSLYNQAGLLVETETTNNGLARLDLIEIPETGSYKFLIMEDGADESGSYGYSLQKVNPAEEATTLAPGDSVLTSLDQVAQMDAYTMDLSPGKMAIIAVEGITLDISPRVEVYRPNGTRILTDIGLDNIFIEFFPDVTGPYTILVLDDDGCELGSYRITVDCLVSTQEETVATFSLQNYPNPFVEKTTIRFELPETARTHLRIVNQWGQEVALLVSEELTSGAYEFDWQSNQFEPGFYIIQLQVDSQTVVRKIVKAK